MEEQATVVGLWVVGVVDQVVPQGEGPARVGLALQERVGQHGQLGEEAALGVFTGQVAQVAVGALGVVETHLVQHATPHGRAQAVG